MSDLATLLVRHRDDVQRYVARHAGRVLRYESTEDLVQGIHVRALERSSNFEYRGDRESLGWLFAVVRGFLADRADYWHALKRRPARLVRLTQGAGTSADPHAAREPVRDSTGPVTFADRRERLEVAVKALALLLPRDADIVQCHAEGLSVQDLADRFTISYQAAQRARHRALERFRKAYRVLTS